MTYQYWRDVGGLWHWHFKDANGVVLFRSESYRTKMECLYTIRVMRESFGATEINLTPDAK